MFTSNYSFHVVDPSLSSYKIIHEAGKEWVLEKLKRDNIKLYSIRVNDWHCVALGAKIGDIICIKNHIANIYRRVIE